jgi:hypothetical protein
LSSRVEVIQTMFSVRWFKQDPYDVVYKLVEAATRAHGSEQRFLIIVSEEKGEEYMSC